MNRLILALALFGIALGANAALLMRAGPGHAPQLGTARVEMGRIALSVPQALIREKVQFAGGRLDRLDLALAIQTFEPLPQPSAEDPFRPMPERLTLILTASRGEPVASELFHTVYARFLARETWSNPGGLVMRRFRQGTPYEDRELYLGVGGRRSFVALCPLDAHREMEPCLTRIRVGDLDAELRFNARHLPDWRRILQETSLLLESLPVAKG